MVDYYDSIVSIASRLDDKQQKRFRPQVLANLNRKLLDIGDEEDNQQLHSVYQQLQNLADGSSEDQRAYKKAFYTLQKNVRRKHGLTEKDTIKNEIIGIGIALGVAFGGAFVSINTALIGVGIPIGLAVGVAIGTQKEKAAEEAGKTY